MKKRTVAKLLDIQQVGAAEEVEVDGQAEEEE